MAGRISSYLLIQLNQRAKRVKLDRNQYVSEENNTSIAVSRVMLLYFDQAALLVLLFPNAINLVVVECVWSISQHAAQEENSSNISNIYNIVL